MVGKCQMSFSDDFQRRRQMHQQQQKIDDNESGKKDSKFNFIFKFRHFSTFSLCARALWTLCSMWLHKNVSCRIFFLLHCSSFALATTKVLAARANARFFPYQLYEGIILYSLVACVIRQRMKKKKNCRYTFNIYALFIRVVEGLFCLMVSWRFFSFLFCVFLQCSSE